MEDESFFNDNFIRHQFLVPVYTSASTAKVKILCTESATADLHFCVCTCRPAEKNQAFADSALRIFTWIVKFTRAFCAWFVFSVVDLRHDPL